MAIISTCRDMLLSSFCKMVQLGNTHILSHSNKQNTRSNRRKFSRNYFTCSQCDLNHALNGRNMTSTQVKLSISAFLLYVVGLIGFSNTQLPHSLYPRSRGQSFFLFNTRCFWSPSSLNLIGLNCPIVFSLQFTLHISGNNCLNLIGPNCFVMF